MVVAPGDLRGWSIDGEVQNNGLSAEPGLYIYKYLKIQEG